MKAQLALTFSILLLSAVSLGAENPAVRKLIKHSKDQTLFKLASGGSDCETDFTIDAEPNDDNKNLIEMFFGGTLAVADLKAMDSDISSQAGDATLGMVQHTVGNVLTLEMGLKDTYSQKVTYDSATDLISIYSAVIEDGKTQAMTCNFSKARMMFSASDLQKYFRNKQGTWKLYEGSVSKYDAEGVTIESSEIAFEITVVKKSGHGWIQTKDYCLKDKPCVQQVNKYEILDDQLIVDGSMVDVSAVSPTMIVYKYTSPKGFISKKVESINGDKLSEEFGYFIQSSGESERGIQLSKRVQ